jgi:hypothetical protein
MTFSNGLFREDHQGNLQQDREKLPHFWSSAPEKTRAIRQGGTGVSRRAAGGAVT